VLRFETPETLGEKKPYPLDPEVAEALGANEKQPAQAMKSIDFTLGSGNLVTLTSDQTKTPPNSSQADVREEGGIWGGSFRYGVLKNLDLKLQTNLNDRPLELFGKFQILGSPRVEAEDGFKLAVQGGVGVISINKEQQPLFESKVLYQTTLTSVRADAGLLAGYRFSPVVLVYSSHFASQISDTFSWEEKLNLDKSRLQSLDGKMLSTLWSHLLGMELLSGGTSFSIEGGLAYHRLPSASRRGTFLGGRLAFFF
jgi:hypothetical protein